MSREEEYLKQEISKGWELVTLGEICEIERGITFPASAKSTRGFEGNIACLRTTNVQESVKWNDLIYVPKTYVKSSYKLLRQNDILISMANSRELVGKVSFVGSVVVQSTFGGFIAAIRVAKGIDPRFLFYYLRAGSTQEQLRKTASQTVNIANLSLDGIYNTTAPLAPVTEQIRIVQAIEQQFTRLDAGVAALQRAKAKLKRNRAAVLKAAVEGKLTET